MRREDFAVTVTDAVLFLGSAVALTAAFIMRTL